MAHTMKAKRAAVGQLGAHIDRLRRDGEHYGNENIDLERTPLNYDLSGCGKPLTQLVQEAVTSAPKTVRKDAVVLGSTVVTLPKDWPDGRDPREFFEAVRAFDLAFWPKSYVEARATVHMDETTPHLHHVFIPLDATGMPNWNKTYTRRMYQRYHEELQRSVCDATGLDTLHILLDADDVAGKALSGLDQGKYKAAKAAEAHAVERAEAAEAEAKEACEKADEAQERLERLRGREERAEQEVESRQKELEALDASRGERDRYLMDHDGAERRVRGREKEVADWRGTARDLEEKVERARAQVERAEQRAKGLAEEVERARAHVGNLERLVSHARKVAAKIARAMREAGARVVKAMGAPTIDPAMRAATERMGAVVRSLSSWSPYDIAEQRQIEEEGGHHGFRI